MPDQDLGGISQNIVQVAPDVRIHYASAGSGPRTALLIHGFPQTWWEWREVLPRLAEAGWRAIAVDYRGAGNSSKPAGGYDKRTMAGDIRTLLHDHLGITEQVAIIGHDIGAMVAYAYAAHFRDEVSHLALLDTIIPGTQGFDAARVNPRAWHMSFHLVLDLPELLVQGKERDYLRHIIETRIVDPSNFPAEAIETYVRAYQATGAMRAGFDVYRAMDRDIADNRANLRELGKLKMPVLALSGAKSPLDAILRPMVEEVAENIAALAVPDTNHWLADENPKFVAEALLRFLETA